MKKFKDPHQKTVIRTFFNSPEAKFPSYELEDGTVLHPYIKGFTPVWMTFEKHEIRRREEFEKMRRQRRQWWIALALTIIAIIVFLGAALVSYLLK